MIATVEEVSTEFHRVLAANHAHVVRDLIPAHDGEIGQEDLRAQIGEARNIQANFTRHVRHHVELGVVVLQPQLILRLGAELMEPRCLRRAVIRQN